MNINGKKLDKFINYEDVNGKNTILNFEMKWVDLGKVNQCQSENNN